MPRKSKLWSRKHCVRSGVGGSTPQIANSEYNSCWGWNLVRQGYAGSFCCCDVVCDEFILWFWWYCFVMMFHQFRRAFFQQDKSCWKIEIVFGLGYVVNCSDCFWVGCLWFVILKCLRSIVFMLCMLWVVRFGVQGLEDGQTMANPILTIYIRIA